MTFAAFRTSNTFYRARPAANRRAARYAWDVLAGRGPIESMRLLDGYWMCLRPSAGEADYMDDLDAAFVRGRTGR